VAAVAFAGIIAWFVNGLFVNNAFEVLLDGEHIGYIQIAEDLTSEEFHDLAVLHLEASRGGANVNVTQRVTLREARVPAAQRSARGDVFQMLALQFDFTIAFTQVYVHGNPEALMRTQTDLEHLKTLLQERWFDPNGHTYRAEFVDGWVEETVYLCPNETEFDTPLYAFRRIDRTRMDMYRYTVVSGDNLGLISVRFGTDLNRILRDNPQVQGTNIFPGDVLYIYTSRPLLTVRTFDRIPTEEIIEMPIQRIPRYDLPSHVTNIIQYGRTGKQVTYEEIIRENGAERSRTVLEAEIVVYPEYHIIEEGTGAGQLDVR
jgi:LysM repeat protein